MTEPEIATPPTCAGTWASTPGIEATTCERPARWCITGEDGGGAVLATFLSCDAAQHQAQCRSLAWQTYNVAIVKTRRITVSHAPGLPTGEATE